MHTCYLGNFFIQIIILSTTDILIFKQPENRLFQSIFYQHKKTEVKSTHHIITRSIIKILTKKIVFFMVIICNFQVFTDFF